MILIADSGSTKTHWSVVDKSGVVKQTFSKGINPFYQTEEEIKADLADNLLPALVDLDVKQIFFYGAGCAFPDKKLMVKNALLSILPHAVAEIESDLLGAARALFLLNKGVACIMGTGSNSCFYNGEAIVDNVSPLGFILGDEGSGAVLGKHFVSNCLKNQVPPELKEKFMTQYALSPAIILDKVYKQAFPNRYLAQFSPFLLENIEEPSVFNLVYDCFESFFVRNVMQYDLEDVEVGFVGSIAYHFADTLEIVASELGIAIFAIVQSPMDGLVEYHKI